MTTFVRRHLLAVSAAVVVLVGAAAWLAFGYFGVHTLFVDNEVDEALPSFDRIADVVAESSTPDSSTPESTTPDTTTPATTTPDTTTPGAVEIRTDAMGTFESLGRYRTVGTALILGDGSEQRFLRFEDFETSNGPDLNVYLVNSSTGDVSDFIDLGDLRGNIGNQNYEIPADADLSVYDTVMIWCVRFSTGFGQAPLELI